MTRPSIEELRAKKQILDRQAALLEREELRREKQILDYEESQLKRQHAIYEQLSKGTFQVDDFSEYDFDPRFREKPDPLARVMKVMRQASYIMTCIFVLFALIAAALK